jgi:hypothetical protein
MMPIATHCSMRGISLRLPLLLGAVARAVPAEVVVLARAEEQEQAADAVHAGATLQQVMLRRKQVPRVEPRPAVQEQEGAEADAEVVAEEVAVVPVLAQQTQRVKLRKDLWRQRSRQPKPSDMYGALKAPDTHFDMRIGCLNPMAASASSSLPIDGLAHGTTSGSRPAAPHPTSMTSVSSSFIWMRKVKAKEKHLWPERLLWILPLNPLHWTATVRCR